MTLRVLARLWPITTLAGLASACAPSAAAPKTAPAAAATAPADQRSLSARTAAFDASWSHVALQRLAVGVDLPDASRWKQLAGSRWVRIEHAPSRSLLELSVSRERRLVKPSDCEAKARLEHPELPRPAEGEALEQRRIKLDNDMLAELTVSLENVSSDELLGHATLFGASVGRCLSAHFVTRVSGPTRDDEVARRLRLVVDRLLPSLTLLVADQRVQEEPLER